MSALHLKVGELVSGNLYEYTPTTHRPPRLINPKPVVGKVLSVSDDPECFFQSVCIETKDGIIYSFDESELHRLPDHLQPVIC